MATRPPRKPAAPTAPAAAKKTRKTAVLQSGPVSTPSPPITVAAEGELMHRVVSILDQARANVVRAVNSNMVIAYWLIGREIVQALQGGEDRAAYGRELLVDLSGALTKRYGRGFSVTNLKYFRLFYQTPDTGTVLADLAALLERVDQQRGFSARLSWTHYRTLCSVENRAERLFYEQEAERSQWSQPELQRQIFSHLFLRLVKSTDKAGVLQLAQEGQVLTHQDVGQMDMYVRMFDDLRRTKGDNPSVGLILCAERDEVVARYSVLNESQQLFASKYMLYLPTEEELRTEIARNRRLIEALRSAQKEDGP